MRSPLFYAMGRGMDTDAGGAAELQTDVMRFMAILSLCLVAIFALVQSLPVVEKVTAPPATEISAPVETTAIEETAAIVTVKNEAVIEAPVEAPKKPVPVPTKIVEEPVVTKSSSASPKVGFTLQFESDDTLTKLVSSHDVGLYAISPDKSLRLGVEGRRLNFWPASTPTRYHEMDGSTVPVEVRRALLRAGIDAAVAPTWGVTLPPQTASQLQLLLASASGGNLVIGKDGNLRLEP
jgi:hypothetical protein